MDHHVYILQSEDNYLYIGYTLDPFRRLRQHNGEIAGGAKKTSRHKGWRLMMALTGFSNKSQALRFEKRWQKCVKRIRNIQNAIFKLELLLEKGDGSKSKKTLKPWPVLRYVYLTSDIVYPPDLSNIPYRPDTVL